MRRSPTRRGKAEVSFQDLSWLHEYEGNAELSKAINSMFRWYWDSVACVAFLSDMVREEMACLPKDDGL
ncbi:HET domain-containing protein [Colletotrichum higginsianum IMI 349063]|uniref:HET domain-containing protein n=1 Tax=Colletotrichum higginsianum (strain IMI 349063) TaxID=759273 RepID=A0A1B7YJ35_COLHI|nr:HET domain-containing protein [Colletotrichum higginsianum IMI 349063]OBR11894.1 HET domain-containing protein [Colletotrichum higginsianum IMI 349063]GJC93565.1 HET domain-containing protein [Colletotrichum higginsianum]